MDQETAQVYRNEAERRIREILAKLEEDTGRTIEMVDVDMHNFVRLSTSIMFKED